MILTDNDIFEESIRLQKEGCENHDECLMIFVNTFGDENDKCYGMALIELNRMIEIFGIKSLETPGE